MPGSRAEARLAPSRLASRIERFLPSPQLHPKPYLPCRTERSAGCFSPPIPAGNRYAGCTTHALARRTQAQRLRRPRACPYSLAALRPSRSWPSGSRTSRRTSHRVSGIPRASRERPVGKCAYGSRLSCGDDSTGSAPSLLYNRNQPLSGTGTSFCIMA